MTAPTRAAVWLDHHEARIFHVDLDGFDEHTLRAPVHHFHRTDEHRFFDDVASALATADEVLVLGPSTAKSAFVNYAQVHARAVASKITDVETSDHPTDAQIVAHVRSHYGIPAPRVE